MGVFLYLAFINVDFNEVLNAIVHASFLWTLIFIALFLFSHLVRAYRWKVMISSVKPDASMLNLFGSLMIGYGVNNVVPRLGEVYRGLFLGKWENISRSSMLGTVILERIIDIFVLAVSAYISVFIYTGDLYKDITWLKSTLILGFAAIFLAFILLILLIKLKEKFYNVIVKLVGKVSHKLADKLGYIFEMLIEGLRSIKGTKNLLLTIVLSVLIMLVYGAASFSGFYMLKMEDIKIVSYGMAWVLMTIGAFGIVIPTPGGTGSYHIITIFVLTSLFGFSKEISAAYALLTHFISYVIFIFATVLFIYIINKKQAGKGAAKENFFSVFKINTD
jgi:uncharacterized protein (TIRG00374 family)